MTRSQKTPKRTQLKISHKKKSKDIRSKGQNVKIQKVERQTVDRHKVEWTNGRTLEKGKRTNDRKSMKS